MEKLISKTDLPAKDCEDPQPRVGVGVIVVKEKKILFGKRKNSHGSGSYAFPGGHLHFRETVEDCARRELEEETGLRACSLRLGPWVQNIIDHHKHYITCFVIVESFEGELQNLEPNKCEGWEWYPWDAMPEPLFPSMVSVRDESGFNDLFQKESTNSLLRKIEKLELEAKEFGFYWENLNQLIEQVQSECLEIQEAWNKNDPSHLQEEVGDLIQAAISLSIFCGLDPYETLLKSIQKFQKRYSVLVDMARRDGYNHLRGQSLEVLMKYWNLAKTKFF